MTKDRDERFEQGRTAEFNVLMRLTISLGTYVGRCGVESWMPGYAHKLLRTVYDNQTINAIRHFPDFYTDNQLIQVKSAPGYNNHPFVTIEQASFYTSLELSRAGISVLIIWNFVNNRPDYLTDDDMAANYVDQLHPIEPKKDRHEANGAMTPFYFIKVAELIPLKYFEDPKARALLQRSQIKIIGERYKQARGLHG